MSKCLLTLVGLWKRQLSRESMTAVAYCHGVFLVFYYFSVFLHSALLSRFYTLAFFLGLLPICRPLYISVCLLPRFNEGLIGKGWWSFPSWDDSCTAKLFWVFVCDFRRCRSFIPMPFLRCDKGIYVQFTGITTLVIVTADLLARKMFKFGWWETLHLMLLNCMRSQMVQKSIFDVCLLIYPLLV